MPAILSVPSCDRMFILSVIILLAFKSFTVIYCDINDLISASLITAFSVVNRIVWNCSALIVPASKLSIFATKVDKDLNSA